MMGMVLLRNKSLGLHEPKCPLSPEGPQAPSSPEGLLRGADVVRGEDRAEAGLIQALAPGCLQPR